MPRKRATKRVTAKGKTAVKRKVVAKKRKPPSMRRRRPARPKKGMTTRGAQIDRLGIGD